jgi:hypothetical protein
LLHLIQLIAGFIPGEELAERADKKNCKNSCAQRIKGNTECHRDSVMEKMQSLPLAFIVMSVFSLFYSPGHSIAAGIGQEAENDFGFGEMFTPQQDFTLTGINLQVTGYSDQNFGTQQSSTLELYLSNDYSSIDPTYPFPRPSTSNLFGGVATINSGTGTEYEFSLSESLDGDTPYWLSVFMVGPDGNVGISADWSQTTLVSGGPAAIVVDGYESGVNFIGPPYQSGTAVPISVVPEPSINSMLILGSICLLLYRQLTPAKLPNLCLRNYFVWSPSKRVLCCLFQPGQSG